MPQLTWNGSERRLRSGPTPGSCCGWNSWYSSDWWKWTGARSEGTNAGGRLPTVMGYVNARVLVMTPDARRRDALAGLLAERVRATGVPAGLLGRFWLAERSVLEGAELTAPVWRRAGSEDLWPLVTAGTLALATP